MAFGLLDSVAFVGDNVIFNTAVTGSPLTSSGTLTPVLKTQTKNAFLAGPVSGANSAPTFRSISANDFNDGTGASTSTFLRGDLTWSTPAGGGDVTGPASSTDTAVPRFSGTGGKTLQNSGVTIDGSNNIASAAHTITSNASTALIVGPNGTTNPVFKIDASTASQADGVLITGAAAGTGPTISPISSGANTPMTITSLGTSSLQLNTAGTGSILIRPAGSTRYTFGPFSAAFNPTTSGTAATVRFGFTAAGDTSLTSGAESPCIDFNLSATRQHQGNTGIALQRDMRVRGTTHSFSTSGGVITDVTALAVEAPVAGTNATFTRKWAATFDANVSVTGGVVEAVRTVTGDFTFAESDGVVFADTTAAGLTATLPTAVGRPGRIFKIIKTNANFTVTIATTGGQTVNGTTPAALASISSVHYISDGSNWFIN